MDSPRGILLTLKACVPFLLISHPVRWTQSKGTATPARGQLDPDRQGGGPLGACMAGLQPSPARLGESWEPGSTAGTTGCFFPHLALHATAHVPLRLVGPGLFSAVICTGLAQLVTGGRDDRWPG